MNDEKEKLDKYLKKFSNLQIYVSYKKYGVFGKAPFKPFFLLSLISLNKHNKIDLKNIPTDEISNRYLQDIYDRFWDCISFEREKIFNPIYALESNKNERILNIDYREGETPRVASSWSNLNQMVEKISLDEDLIPFLNDDESREKLIKAIFAGGYFDPINEKAVKEKITEIDGWLKSI